MPEILNLQVNPRDGIVKTANSLSTVAVTNKENGTNQTSNSESKVPGKEATGTTTGTENNSTSQTSATSPNKESVQETKQPDVKDLENDPKFQAIAKREREFRTRETQVKQMLAKRENDLNARLGKFEAESQEKLDAINAFSKLAENARRNPEPYLRHVFGDNWYENAVQFKLNGRPVPELVQEQIETKLSAEIKSLREERELEREQLKKEQERQRQVYESQQDKENQEVINNFYKQTEDYIKSKPETFELIHMQGKQAFNLVNQLQEAEYVQNGRFISAQEAAERVENFLTEQVKSYSKAKKFGQSATNTQARTEEASRTDTRTIDQKFEVSLSSPENPNRGARTLTNQMTVSTPSVMTQNLSERERIRRAMAAMDAVTSKK